MLLPAGTSRCRLPKATENGPFACTTAAFVSPKKSKNMCSNAFTVPTPRAAGKAAAAALGLAIAKAIVDEHKGKIAVESKTEQGTTFTVLLSACDPASKSENKAT